MTLFTRLISAAFTLPLCLAPVSSLAQDKNTAIPLQVPVNCTLDQDCFIQQLADMDESQESLDPFCGAATYDGHKGTDIRLRTLADIDNNIEVLAAAGGTVKGVRSSRPDRLVESPADQRAVKGMECGNGVVIDHGSNIQTQYCHLKQDSLKVSLGDTVKSGDILGHVGASGLAQFPHVHMTLRKDGRVVDPFTGNMQSQGCAPETHKSWWAEGSILTAQRDAILLDSNITGAPIKHTMMVREQPLKASRKDSATVGWVWYSNLKAGDQVFIKLVGPNGFEVENLSDPLNRNKASWSGFVGKNTRPRLGAYKLTTYILRKGENGSPKTLSLSERDFAVKD